MFNWAIGVKAGVDTTVLQIVQKPERFVINWFNKAIVWFPSSKGSFAFFEPKNIFSVWKTAVGVSTLKEYSEREFMDTLSYIEVLPEWLV